MIREVRKVSLRSPLQASGPMGCRAPLIVAALFGTVVMFSPPAAARNNVAPAIIGGLIGLGVGAAIAGSAAPPAYGYGYGPPPPAYYPPPPGYYSPPPQYYAPPPPPVYYGR